MKLVSFERKSCIGSLGVATESGVIDVASACGWAQSEAGWALGPVPQTMDRLLEAGSEGVSLVGELARLVERSGGCKALTRQCVWPLAEIRLLPPVLRPGKIICFAGNYLEHVKEGGIPADVSRNDTTPWMFLKPPSSLAGPEEDILLPRLGADIDWEVELAVIMGRLTRHVEPSEALQYVFGYSVFNDISARSLNLSVARKEREWHKFFDWMHGKWFDTFACLGPYLVTKDEVPDPQKVRLRLSVNGIVRQESSTSMMLFTVAELISFASHFMTLEPGDVLCTGTPAGVGLSHGEFLRPGDVIEAEVEGMGVLRNRVAAQRKGVPCF